MNFLNCTLLLITFLSSLASQSAQASDVLVQSLSDGACWYEVRDEFIKMSSFNDGAVLQFNKDDLSLKLGHTLSLMSDQKLKILNTSPLILHCSGIGHSFITKVVDEKTSSNSCVWFLIKEDEVIIRSVGGIEDDKREFCDGHKMGEGLIGLSREGDINLIKEDGFFKNSIESFVKVSASLYKVKFSAKFLGKEKLVLDELKKIQGIRYTELNKFQHPVGEWAILD